VELSEKHVEFYSKNNLEKLVHLVGFIITIYHDARLSERQKAGGDLICCVLRMWELKVVLRRAVAVDTEFCLVPSMNVCLFLS